MKMKFQGLGIIWIFLSLLPSAVEAVIVALMGRSLLDLNSKLSYSLGFIMGAAGTTGIVPSMYNLKKRDFKIRGIITNILILSTTIDNIVMGTLFSISRDSYQQEIKHTDSN